MHLLGGKRKGEEEKKLPPHGRERRPEDCSSKGSLTLQNILQVARNERIRVRPEGSRLKIYQTCPIKESPRGTNRTSTMSKNTVGKESFRTSFPDTLDNPPSESGLRSSLERMDRSNKQRG